MYEGISPLPGVSRVRASRWIVSALTLGLALCAADSLFAFNWTATGSFKYQDREFDENGFTGITPSLPIRFAQVEVRYKQGGGTQLLASGATDANGNYSIDVLNDSTVRDIQIRVLTASGAPDLFLQITNVNGSKVNYAVTTGFFLSHQPNQNLNAGNFTAVIGAGAEAFNIYDVALNTIDYVKFLNGARPNSSQELKLQWESFGGVFVNSYLGANTVAVADNSPYNDTVIQHETGHFVESNFSARDTPGGTHHLTDCNQDMRLAYDEGWATFWGQSVRLHFGLSHPQLYVKTTGGAGAGNLDFFFDVEDEFPFTCKGGTSEVTVYSTLWDLVDGPSTPDDSPGIEEAWDAMTTGEAMSWDVEKNYIPSAANKSIEDFWDGWFIRNGGSLGSMITLFGQHGMGFHNDLAEPNDVFGSSVELATSGLPIHATFFKDQGNGAGGVDVDFFRFTTVTGQVYKIQTTDLVGDANTLLSVLAPDGVTVLQTNDDRSGLDKSSLITFTAPTAATYYVKSVHSTGWGIYGSYDISVIGTSNQMGAGHYTVDSTANVTRQISTSEGESKSTTSGFGAFNEGGEVQR